MSKPRISEQAEADLHHAWEYLAERNEAAADRLMDDILERARLHAQFPLMGSIREDLGTGLRSFVVSPYIVIYRPFKDTIEVLRVLHGSRDIPEIMNPEDEE
jgi:toxin ParE1/3/4